MKGWKPSYVKGNYVSDNGRYKAELRPAGFYPEFGCKLVRHYAVRYVGSQTVLATPRTLAEAAKLFL